jgi:iron-sulfur cluster repair protein YtfE (RIC family)
MSLFEIHAHFLDDHTTLRGKVSVLRSLALSVLRGDEELASALRRKGQDLQEHLQRHMTWEEENLLPVLDCENPRGMVVATAMLVEHAHQRDRLAESLRDLEETGSRPRKLAESMMDLISWLERDMAAEEEAVLEVIELSPHSRLPGMIFRSGVRRD